MQAKRSRFLMLHPETNSGKVLALEALLVEYVAYVKICVDLMVERKTFSLPDRRVDGESTLHYREVFSTGTIGMRLSEMTSWLETPKNTVTVDFWLKVSSLKSGKTIRLPIVGSPYVQKPSDVGKGFLARKTRGGRWRFEALETRDDDAERPVPTEKVGVDVGLNVIAATSDGRLIGADLKPKFDALYAKVKAVRSNRMRQGLKENSPRLDCLESRLSGLTKSATGEAANKLIKAYPNHVFVIEDLDLRGCRGSKRFCFRALHHNLAFKAVVEVVNPAYTSQECPSCGYVSRSNRSGVKFRCRSCGRKGHADWVGASGVLRRSGDESIGCGDQPIRVREVLRRRFCARRKNSLFGSLPTNAPRPIGQEFTTEVLSKEGIGTASNSMPNFA